ncbi:MAG: tyrosine-type recombinase/integrase [Novosphingobium sp.]|uniref:tyrosine-type recombinase/integrase n=1 Tax=Novosphingobium sp. TaxID=1874826 RepID=UPI0022C26D73|nr:tyrosine-type recombinase/integrase [Novosphingobium sp.]MCZ8018678.1 tyrosine-type recombinase/integrase [Novosphingobium sp.]MCZ8034683.1 tyrosine-type recombinase/integrase [Novosphingobium sp.]MCZ8060576.1 tyrosine-type recombinase/integrase [Novosphingobium sp.]MCZ8264307.1 tyrosine-type recombinase/integrase [Novosphingobium sp.]
MAKGSADNAKSMVTASKTFREGAIYLYQRSDFKKPTWLCRIKIPNTKGYITRSTGTGDEHQAFKFADDLYNQQLVKSLTGETVVGKRIGPAIDAYVRRIEVDKERLSIRYKILLMNRIKPHWAKKLFEDLSPAMISKLVDKLIENARDGRLSPNTIKRIYSDLKHFLQWTIDEGYLDRMPRFPKTNGQAARRPHFDPRDWQRLTRHLREFIKVENKAVRRDRMMLRDYVLILANTGIRVGEARILKWRDIREVGGGPDTPPNIVLTVSGKTGKREVVAASSEIKTYLKRIHDLRIEELATDDIPHPKLDPESLVFCHKDGSEIGSFKKSFAALLKSANVERDTHGQVRTLYSLRHTYATFRLQNGVHQFTLAKNMGTSVAMLEQYYGHTSNIAAADELTKRIKKTVSGAKTSLSWLTD